MTRILYDNTAFVCFGFGSKRSQVRILSPRPTQLFETSEQSSTYHNRGIDLFLLSFGLVTPGQDCRGWDKSGIFPELSTRINQTDYWLREPLSEIQPYQINNRKSSTSKERVSR